MVLEYPRLNQSTAVYPQYNAPAKHPAPSAKSVSHDNQNKFKHRELNLKEENCTICLDGLNVKQPGDINNAIVIAQTDCQHFFHDNCLQEYLAKLSTKAKEKTGLVDCPNCRHGISAKNPKVELIVLDKFNKPMTSVKPIKRTTPKNVTPKNVTPKPAPAVAQQENAIVNTAVKVSKWCMNFVLNTVIGRPSAEQKIAFEKSIAVLSDYWNALMIPTPETKFIQEKNDFVNLLGSIKSLSDTNYNKANTSADKVAKALKVYEDKVNAAKVEYNKALNAEKKLIAALS